MRKVIKTVGTITTIGIMLTIAYRIGRLQATHIENEIVPEKVIEVIPDGFIDTTSEEFYNNFVDMRTVIRYSTDGNGLLLHFSDGCGYYWEP